MAMRGAIWAFLLVALLIAAAGPATGTKENGLPRPIGYPNLPTDSYGPTPPCLNGSVAVTCEWYGFAHILYPTLGHQCDVATRHALSNTTVFPPGTLKPYVYYFFKVSIFDPSTNASYCKYGCFDLGTSAAAPPPPPSLTYPPPDVLPPPVQVSTPPPATVFTPPPSLLTPPPPTTDGATPPPPGPNTRVVNLNGAPGFLRPTGLVSFVLSGALLILHGLAGF